MEDKIDLILYKLKDLKKEIEEVKAIVEAHRIEHGFAKMQDGGVNANFGGQTQGGPPGMGGMGMPGMGAGYQQPGMGGGMPGMGGPMGPGPGIGGPDPSRPPGM